MKTHFLRTINPYFHQVWMDNKKFEVRKNDRDFKAGDVLVLKEYDEKNGYLGRLIFANISYVLEGGQYGVDEDYCIMSIDVFDKKIDLEDKQILKYVT